MACSNSIKMQAKESEKNIFAIGRDNTYLENNGLSSGEENEPRFAKSRPLEHGLLKYDLSMDDKLA
ncbi:hypothetical protein JXB31_03285 [Candidatus Woesearchaeota archaeon]|nr:hypothetical protein [Candidatus Woesearchaeota archaeon]